MSWGEQESLAETLENPDPEEDLDLPRRQDEEVERPEDDLGAVTNAHENNPNESGILAQPETVQNEHVCNVAENECSNSVLVVNECAAQNGNANISESLLDSNEVHVVHSESNFSDDKIEQHTSDDCANVSIVNSENMTFSGDIEISNNIDDAPEAEIAGVESRNARDSIDDEDNMELRTAQHSCNQSSNSDPSSICITQAENVNLLSGVRNILNDDSSEQLNNEVSDMLAPECDRKVESHGANTVREHIETDSKSLVLTSPLHSQNDLNSSQLKLSAGVKKIHVSDSSLVCKPDSSTDIPPAADSKPAEFISNVDTPDSAFDLSNPLHNADRVSPTVHEKDNTSVASCNNNHIDPDPVTMSLSSEEDKILSPLVSTSTIDQVKTNTVLNNQVGFHSPLQRISHIGSASTSQKSSPSRSVPLYDEDSNSLQRQLVLALQSDDEDELLHELDAELLARPKGHRSPMSFLVQHVKPSEQESSAKFLNGLQGFDVRQLQVHNRQLLEQLKIRDEEISRMTQENKSLKEELSQCHCKHCENSTPSADDLYLPQIKELEKTIAQQESELKVVREKLASHDNSAKKTILSLQNELKSRVDQITKLYEDCLKEKDITVVRYAESEAKYLETKRMTEKFEAKAKEAIKEKESMVQAVKTAKADKERLVVNFETKCAEVGNLNKEIDKLKEAISSGEFRIKWFQNKLKDELDQHKETKATLEKTTVKLKEAREETEIIRKECHSIVKRYQESEEIKSNSLDKELKMKETELRTQMQEKNDTEEIHQMTKKELDSLKIQHKDVIEEVKTLKDKVQCLEVERQQNHLMIENYQEIMQRQKTDNVALKAQISALSAIEGDYKRAQEMILSLDKDITELKLTNQDLQKDMDRCKERESRMLNLQSELSRSNALIQSENTTLNNKSTFLANEVERMKKQVQELEDTVKKLKEKYEEEKSIRDAEMEKITLQLSERTKECNDFKQKWEDELDNSKTLKRRHANNIKDLTRQLQQVKKKLESLEGKGDAGSMGSRTNSNGSLNSIDNSQHPQLPQQQETVITEQVQVDKQVLIERIVRLQKAHARKNEKLEFLGEHIEQLLEEIKKKNKIIQTYILREEAGTLSSEEMDSNKEHLVAKYKTEVQKEIQSLLARKGGIMASVYSVHQQDGTMTLDLSLQINRKLQAVLEDTLLKNITLKENLDTLGEEIARLSQENRRLQLSLQDLQHCAQQVQA